MNTPRWLVAEPSDGFSCLIPMQSCLGQSQPVWKKQPASPWIFWKCSHHVTAITSGAPGGDWHLGVWLEAMQAPAMPLKVMLLSSIFYYVCFMAQSHGNTVLEAEQLLSGNCKLYSSRVQSCMLPSWHPGCHGDVMHSGKITAAGN